MRCYSECGANQIPGDRDSGSVPQRAEVAGGDSEQGARARETELGSGSLVAIHCIHDRLLEDWSR